MSTFADHIRETESRRDPPYRPAMYLNDAEKAELSMNEYPLRRDQVHLRDEKCDPRRHQESVNKDDRSRDRRCIEKRFQVKGRPETDEDRDRKKNRDGEKEPVLEIARA